ncbi:MAG: 50S ribosomal protein L22 [Verrucomicrobiota bacterium]|nr:50S ribosomal protein L22 [Verrucomicrobiota bacterium]
MDVKAISKYVRISPHKARDVARLLRGKKAQDALTQLEFIPKKAARLIQKTLKSAIANAENNHDLLVEELFVKEAVVDEGPRMKRFVAKARGMAGRILKRTSHFKIVLSDEA